MTIFASPAVDGRSKAELHGPRRRPRIVVADDYEDLLTALQGLLAPSCDVVALVKDGDALLATVRSLEPDVVVLDVYMRSSSGLQLCKHIRDAMPGTKVVMMTAADEDSLRDMAFKAGASALVVKVRIGDDLVPAIEDAFLGTALANHSLGVGCHTTWSSHWTNHANSHVA